MAVSLEVTRQNIANNNTISPIGAPIMDALQKGSYRGEEVVARSESSKLADSQEEAGMHVAGHAGHDKKTLGKRQIRQGQAANLEALSRISDYYDKLPNMPKEAELQALVETLQTFEEAMNGAEQQGGAPPTAEDLMAALQNFDGDVTHQFAGLDIARQFFEQKTSNTQFENLLAQAQRTFEQGDLGRDVRAGFAAAVVAKQSAATLETDPATVRESYRAMLRKKMGFGQLFDELCKFDMTKNFEEAVSTFTQAAGHDLSSAGPSVDPEFLSALLSELGKLKKMKTVFESAQELIQQSDRLFAEDEKGKTNPVQFTSKFLNFCSKGTVNLADAKGMLTGLEQAAPASKVVFANGIRDLHIQVPDDVMPSDQARLQQVTTIMALLNTLVAAEEAAYQNVHASA